MEVTGIILAGGKSTRMGADKGLELLAGKPLITYAIQALAPHCKNIIISSGSDAYSQFGFQVVADEFPGIGPMGGVYSSLRKSSTEKNLILSCDLPFVTADYFAFVLANSDGFLAAVPHEGGRHYEPLCGFYDRRIISYMSDFIERENYKLPDLFDKIVINRLVVNHKLRFYHSDLFLNVNSKHELSKAEMLILNRLSSDSGIE